MVKRWKHDLAAKKYDLTEAFKQLCMTPIPISGIEEAKALLYEYIRDGYQAMLREDNGKKAYDEHQYCQLLNVAEIAFEAIALSHAPRNDDTDGILVMARWLCNHLNYVYSRNKHDNFRFAGMLGSIYLFLLDMKIDQLEQGQLVSPLGEIIS